MSEQRLIGAPASPGLARGAVWRLAEDVESGGSVAPSRLEDERRAALAALAAAAEALTALAAELPAEEAQIVETGAMMATDPALLAAVEQLIAAQGMRAAEAILSVTGDHADAIAGVGDETLAARADDVRSLGRRAARLASGRATALPARDDVIVIADDLGPADVAELAPALAGIALARGGPTAHAAIVARSLGIPMVTGLGEPLSKIRDDEPLVLDGSSGAVIVSPSAQHMTGAADEMAARRLAAHRANQMRERPAITTDGVRVTVLVNVACREELDVGLRAGAEGIGLLRTELAFLEAEDWPSEQQHTDALEPILSGLGRHPAVVRVLDFGADKSPPFLRGVPQRGIELLLGRPDAFTAQLRAMLLAGTRRDVRVMLPMVDTREQLDEALELMERTARALGIERIPPLGAMIETPAAVENAAALAAGSSFLSIGTNDLTTTTLAADRFADNTARAHHPRVLKSIAASVSAAHEAGIPIEVCGEAASDEIMLPLLVGLGVDQLSVGAARVGPVREWIRRLDAREARGLARSALTMDDAAEVESAARPLAVRLRDNRASDQFPHALSA
jgi:phosphoenolpyruvate-protein kinase (PTS system EI component)